MIKRSAFSLIELLLAVSIFALVASTATVTLTTAVRLQVTRQQTQQISLQSQQILDRIKADIQAAGIESSAISLTNDQSSLLAGTRPNSILTVVSSDKDMYGRDQEGGNKRVNIYCVESQAGEGRRLVRFSRPLLASDSVAPATSCLDQANGEKIYLSNETFQVLSFRISQMENSSSYQLELASRYNLANTNEKLEARASDAKSEPPMVVDRRLVIRPVNPTH